MMEKAVHSRPVSEEDEAFSSGKKLRLEASPGPQDIEKYTIFTDSEYKLPLYLSEFALSVYNSEKETSYEKVNVVKTMKSLDVVEGTTYLVTFEASLPNKSNIAKTFQTNIFMSSFPLDQNTEININIKFVRMKPSEFVYNGKEDSDEKVSESKEEGSEQKVSESKEEGSEEEVFESDEEDSEEELYDESDEEDNEEKLSESDEKDTDEKFGRRKTVGGKSPRVQLVFSFPYYDPPNVNLSAASLKKLVILCQLAICVYNMKEVTYYDNVKVLKATQSAFVGNITFQASLSDGNAINFHTDIWAYFPLPYDKIEIAFVEPKPNYDNITQ